MGTRRILVGVDGSEGSREALRWAIDEAARGDAVIEAILVWQSPFGFGDTFGVHLDESKIEEAARQRLEETVAEVAGEHAAVKVEPVILEGDAAQVLCTHAAGADLLVVGSLGHTPFRRVELGSVSARCAQYSQCPVVIVPKDHQGEP